MLPKIILALAATVSVVAAQRGSHRFPNFDQVVLHTKEPLNQDTKEQIAARVDEFFKSAAEHGDDYDQWLDSIESSTDYDTGLTNDFTEEEYQGAIEKIWQRANREDVHRIGRVTFMYERDEHVAASIIQA